MECDIELTQASQFVARHFGRIFFGEFACAFEHTCDSHFGFNDGLLSDGFCHFFLGGCFGIDGFGCHFNFFFFDGAVFGRQVQGLFRCLRICCGRVTHFHNSLVYKFSRRG